MTQTVPPRATREIMDLFRVRYDCLRHIKISGRGRRKEVVIQEMNDILHANNIPRDSPVRTLISGTQYNPSIAIAPKRADRVSCGNMSVRLISWPYEIFLWEILTVKEIKRLMVQDMRGRTINLNQCKLPLIKEWLEFGDPLSVPYVIRRLKKYRDFDQLVQFHSISHKWQVELWHRT